MRAERNVDPPELSEPVPPPSRGVHDVVVAYVEDAVKYLVEDQPGNIHETHRRTRATQSGDWYTSTPVFPSQQYCVLPSSNYSSSGIHCRAHLGPPTTAAVLS